MDILQRNNIDTFKKELRKTSLAIHLACDTEVAADVSLKINKAVRLIDTLLAEIDEIQS